MKNENMCKTCMNKCKAERMIHNAMQQNKYPIPPQIIMEIFEGTGAPKGGETLEVQEVKKI